MTTFFDKNAFLTALTCPTQGWYTIRKGREEIPSGLRWRFFVGQEIQRIAREQFGPGLLLPRTPESEALAATERAMRDPGQKTLFEASFLAGDFTARADALRRNGDGWDLIEVKSGQERAEGEPKDEYLDDLAYTVFVAKATGVPVLRAFLTVISREYRLGTEKKILVEVDVTEEAFARALMFGESAAAIGVALRSPARPAPELKFACRDCDFFATECLGVGVEDPLFLLPRLTEKKFEHLKAYGRVRALPEDADLSPSQKRVVEVIRSGRGRVEQTGLAYLDEVVWPAHYLDFESINPALPWFAETKPYQAMPFQFSIHIREQPASEPLHHEYLAPTAGDWRRDLTEALIRCLGTQGSVISYSSYEKQMLGYLANLYPDLRPALEGIVARLFDLERVVREGYCDPRFGGRTSIKNVLPAMAPDLSYGELGIQGGDDAAGAFGLMYVGEYPAPDHAGYRRELLAYCRLDTLAMVRVHEALERVRVSGEG